jgi:flagellar motor switch protein FliG
MSFPRPPDLSKPQKAAALVMAVGPEQAAELLSRLNEAEVESLAREIAALKELPVGALQQVIDEVEASATVREGMVEGGMEYAREMLSRWHGPGGEVAARIAHGATDAPFRFLAGVEPGEAAQALVDEHPQTLAVVLAHLPASYAAHVLEDLGAEIQADVALRVATMDWVGPDVVRRVEQVLRQRLGVGAQARQEHRGGAKELAGILNKMNKETEGAVLAGLAERQPELAEEVKALMFVFEDIVTLRDRDLQELFRAIEPKDLAFALKGARDDVRDAVTRNISDRARESLTEETELLGAVRLTDVEAARARIIGQLRAMDEAGKIVLRRDSGGGLVE